MRAYLRPSGVNGSRFNLRLAKAHKVAARALKVQRAEDAQLLASVREFYFAGGDMASMPHWLLSKVLVERRDGTWEWEVIDRSTGRLLGHIVMGRGMGVRQC
ncbi:MAG: hypothetical protein RSC66_04610 [Comamonas sp.]